MKKLLIMALLAIYVLSGCGNNKKSGSIVLSNSGTPSKTVNIPESAEVLVEDFLYVDLITETDKKIILYLPNVHTDEDIATCLYFVAYTANELFTKEVEYELSIALPDKTYVLDVRAEAMKNIGFPEEWNEFIKKNGLENAGATMSKFLTETQTDNIEYMVKEKIIDVLPKEDFSETNVLAEKKYKVDKKEFSISLNEKDNKCSIIIKGIAKSKEKACIILGTFATMLDELDIDGYSIIVYCKDLYIVFMSANGKSITYGINTDGTFTLSAPDWLTSDFTMPKKKRNSIMSEINSLLLDFADFAIN